MAELLRTLYLGSGVRMRWWSDGHVDAGNECGMKPQAVLDYIAAWLASEQRSLEMYAERIGACTEWLEKWRKQND